MSKGLASLRALHSITGGPVPEQNMVSWPPIAAAGHAAGYHAGYCLETTLRLILAPVPVRHPVNGEPAQSVWFTLTHHRVPPPGTVAPASRKSSNA